MTKNNLNNDIESFLGKYFSFEKVESPKLGYLALEGKISVVDNKDKLWGHFEVFMDQVQKLWEICIFGGKGGNQKMVYAN